MVQLGGSWLRRRRAGRAGLGMQGLALCGMAMPRDDWRWLKGMAMPAPERGADGLLGSASAHRLRRDHLGAAHARALPPAAELPSQARHQGGCRGGLSCCALPDVRATGR